MSIHLLTIIRLQAKTYIPVIAVGFLHIFLPMHLLLKILIDCSILFFFTIVLIKSNKKIVDKKKENCLLLDEAKIGINVISILFVSLTCMVILSILATIIVSLFTFGYNRGLVDTFIGVLISFLWIIILIIYGLFTTKYSINSDGVYLVSGIWCFDLKYTQIKEVHHDSRRITLFPYPILSERMPTIFLGNRFKDFICIETQAIESLQLYYSKIYITPTKAKPFLDFLQEQMSLIGS